jgi:mRNA-degrading endonuclease RelE of RelBE toxin-antitoxin system
MKVIFTKPVDIALRTLGTEDRNRVMSLIHHLQNNDAFLREHSQKLDQPEGVYVLKTTSDIRIFYRVEGDTIAVLDVAKKATILTSGHIPENRLP